MSRQATKAVGNRYYEARMRAAKCNPKFLTRAGAVFTVSEKFFVLTAPFESLTIQRTVYVPLLPGLSSAEETVLFLSPFVDHTVEPGFLYCIV